MRIHGGRIEEITVIEKILRSLTAKFNFVVCAIEESKDIDDLSLDELQSSLVVHEQKFKQEDTDEQALKASTDTRSNNFPGRGRGRDRGRGRGRSTNFRANNDQFQGRGRGGAPDKSKEEGETLLMVAKDEKQIEPDVWYVDTGCSNHMSGSKSSFSHLNENFQSTVSFGDHSTVKVMGKGDIKIKTKNGFVETISNVLYVPDLKSNLLSAGQLQEKGYVITIKNGVCEIYDSVRGAIVVIQMSSNRLFPLKIEGIQSSCLCYRGDALLFFSLHTNRR
ncbi:uncharacterized protein LOC133285140 [Gastrolobium bilobum]|uniref:uncharacterized protein LOC133285140 n=1 Tax=Gastrolobium bilobum TaxID=150636 RepID=UPI002AB1F7F5|nr:uncharacterized protein LOC133285140 [Gastrolobium bilobum]